MNEKERIMRDLRKAQVSDAYRQTREAFDLLRKAKRDLLLVMQIEGAMAPEAAQQIKETITAIEQFLPTGKSL